MFKSIAIALISFLLIAGAAAGQGWKPSWAPEPIPLVQGAEYKTGSPLSKNGLAGFLGGLGNAVTGGAMPEWTGGGSVVWQGAADPVCNGVVINSVCMPTFTQAEAAAAQESIDRSQIQNEDHKAKAPGPHGGCSYSFQKAIESDSAMNWCEGEGKAIEHASVGHCTDGQQVHVAYIEDAALGARAIYYCQEVAE